MESTLKRGLEASTARPQQVVVEERVPNFSFVRHLGLTQNPAIVKNLVFKDVVVDGAAMPVYIRSYNASK